MSIHARSSQLFLVRPTVRGIARNLPVRRAHALALQPTRSLVSGATARPTHIVAIGAFLSAGVAVLTREAALCQQLDAVFSNVSDGASASSGSGKPVDDASKPNRRSSLMDEIDLLVDQMMSRCGEISLAGGLGFCSGYALKQVGKVAAVTIGTLFVIVQAAQYKGYIEIHWHKVEKDVVKAVDPDGDGKITKKDLHEWYKRLMVVLQKNLPSSAGFAGGFLLGVSCS